MLPVGRVKGHRGRGGELTVRVSGGDAALWTGSTAFWIDDERYDVEHVRAYRDRLVLKLAGVDDATRAANLRGCSVGVARDEAPVLPAGVFMAPDLVGLSVQDEQDRRLGRVADVIATGGTDLLVVHGAGRDEQVDEMLIPMAKEIVIEVDVEKGFIRIRPPEGLLELNRR